MTDENRSRRGSALPVVVGVFGVVIAAAALVLAIKAGMVIRDQQDKLALTDSSVIDALTEIIETQQNQLDELAENVADLTELVESLDTDTAGLYYWSDDTEDTTTSAPDEQYDAMSDDIIDVMVNDSFGVVYNSCGFESSYDDRDRFCVYLDFYNQSGETTCYGDPFYLVAFQGGVELDDTYLTSDVAYDTGTMVQDGYSATICESFYLRDTSDVTLELHCYIDWSDQIVDVMSISFDN